MARLSQRLDENTPGDFFVDDACIDCETCRILAPDSLHGEVRSRPRRRIRSEAEPKLLTRGSRSDVLAAKASIRFTKPKVRPHLASIRFTKPRDPPRLVWV
jgi:hypothetical protein